MKKIKALILDAGGVMVRPIHGNWNIPVRYEEILGNSIKNTSIDEYLEICAEEFDRYLSEDRFVTDIKEEYAYRHDFLRTVFDRLQISVSDQQLSSLAEDFTYNPARYEWYSDTDPILTALHQDYKIGILSDAMPSFKLVAEEHDKTLHNFDALSISTFVGCAKPDPRMYKDILAKLQIPADACIFIDDRICNLEGAARLGIHTVQMCRDGLIGGDGPIVHDLAEFKAYVEALQ